MRFQHFVCLLLAGFAFGQAAPPATAPATPPAAAATADQTAAPAAPAPAPEANVGPDDTVITLKGFCTDSSLQGDACKTVITRAQFEKITAALQPNMSPAVRRQAATFYARMLKMSTDAEKRGLDKGPMFDEKLAIARMQILSQELTRAMQEDSAKITDADIEDYYKKNEGNFEQATFERIFVPRTKQIDPAAKSSASSKTGVAAGAKTAAKPATPAQPTEAQTKAAEESMKKLADTLRARAAKGEDPEKLQTEAHVAAGLPGNAPISKMEKVRRTALPQNHQTVMSLNVGEVSEVIADPNGGYYVYKMISKETLPLDTVKPEIKNTMSSQRYRDSMQTFQNPASLDLSEAYFGPVRNSAMPVPPRGVRPVPQPQSQSKDPE
jgi:PPIC-type PPIASE domain